MLLALERAKALQAGGPAALKALSDIQGNFRTNFKGPSTHGEEFGFEYSSTKNLEV